MFVLLAIKIQFGKENDLLQKRAHEACGTQQRPRAHLIRCSDPCHISPDLGRGHRPRRCLELDSDGKLGTSVASLGFCSLAEVFSVFSAKNEMSLI